MVLRVGEKPRMVLTEMVLRAIDSLMALKADGCHLGISTLMVL
jgi:hypothetical protein